MAASSQWAYRDGLTKSQTEREWGDLDRHANRASGADGLCAPPRGPLSHVLDKALRRSRFRLDRAGGSRTFHVKLLLDIWNVISSECQNVRQFDVIKRRRKRL